MRTRLLRTPTLKGKDAEGPRLRHKDRLLRYAVYTLLILEAYGQSKSVILSNVLQ